jgi:hypothetical protein
MAAPTTLTRTVTFEPGQVPVWDATRRRVDVARSLCGRVATVVGTAAAVAVWIHPALAWEAIPAVVAVTAAGAGILRLSAPIHGHQKAAATVLHTVPGVSLAVLLTAERAVAGVHWPAKAPMELLAIAVWAGGTWLVRPARVARRMVTPRPPAAPTAPAPMPAAYGHPAARWWGEHVAAKGGPAVGTLLEGIELTGKQSMTAIIRAEQHGQPVPDISIRHLSALLDLPEDQIAITAVPGRGAGVRRLTVGKTDTDPDADPATVWAQRIAPMAMPDAVLTGVRVGKPGTPADPADTAIDTQEDA